MNDEHTALDDFDVVRNAVDLEAHLTDRREEPAWILVSPMLLPGVYLVEQGRLQSGDIGEMCRVLAVQFDALAAGDAEGLVRAFFMLAPMMRSLFPQTVRDVAEYASSTREH